jgi:hypothetical protein
VHPESPQPPVPEPESGAPLAGAGAPSSSGPRSAGPPCAAGFYTPRDARHLRRVNAWMIAAALADLGATAALHRRGSIPIALSWPLVGVAWLLAIAAIRSYLVFLRGADELLRRIQTDALAQGFGVGVVLSLLYPLLEELGAPKLDSHITAAVMMFSWSAGSWLGTRRYSGSGAP